MLQTIDRILNLENNLVIERRKKRTTARNQTEIYTQEQNTWFSLKQKRAYQALIDKLLMVHPGVADLALTTQIRITGEPSQMSCSL